MERDPHASTPVTADTARLTDRQADIITAATGTLVGDFASFQLFAEKLLGRPIMTHEFADHATWEEVKEAARPYLMAICPESVLPALIDGLEGGSRSPLRERSRALSMIRQGSVRPAEGCA